jgi:hypothetical protein
MSMTPRTLSAPRRLAVLAALLGLASLPAGADWLVTRQGGRVETRGAWEVKGKLVVFRTMDNTLSSLRTSEVDLEASRKATEEADRARSEAAAAPAKPPVRKPSVLVLTDKDVRHVEEGSSGTADGTPAAAGETAREDLTVANWERSADSAEGHVVITGTIRNTAAGSTATGVNLTVSLFDESGRQVGSAEAVLTTNALPAGQQSGFRAEFPGVFAFSDLKFAPKGTLLKAGPPEPEPAASGG